MPGAPGSRLLYTVYKRSNYLVSCSLFILGSLPTSSSSVFPIVRSGHHGASPGIGSSHSFSLISSVVDPTSATRIWLWSQPPFSVLVSSPCTGLSLNFPRLRQVTCRSRDGGQGYVGLRGRVPCRQILHCGSSLSAGSLASII